MPIFRLTPEQTIMYYKNDNPIVLFLFEHCGDSEFGQNWLFTRLPSKWPKLDRLEFEPQVDLYIKDPEVAVLFKLKFGT